MLEEALVLGGEDGLLHDLGDVLDMDEIAPFFAELADQVAVAGKHAKRDLRLVVGEHVDRRQPRIGQNCYDADHRRGDGKQTGDDEKRVDDPA